jgi:lysosome membrane protein 2
MVSNMVKTAIVGSVGVAVIILSSTLGWILVPDIATSVLYNFPFLVSQSAI